MEKEKMTKQQHLLTLEEEEKFNELYSREDLTQEEYSFVMDILWRDFESLGKQLD
jgi:hypothetical protein